MARAAGVNVTLIDCDLPAAEFGQLFRIEARLPAFRGRRAEFDIARRLAPVVLCNDGQLAVLASIGFAAETAAFSSKR